jgi:hypothetical protein
MVSYDVASTVHQSLIYATDVKYDGNEPRLTTEQFPSAVALLLSQTAFADDSVEDDATVACTQFSCLALLAGSHSSTLYGLYR